MRLPSFLSHCPLIVSCKLLGTSCVMSRHTPVPSETSLIRVHALCIHKIYSAWRALISSTLAKQCRIDSFSRWSTTTVHSVMPCSFSPWKSISGKESCSCIASSKEPGHSYCPHHLGNHLLPLPQPTYLHPPHPLSAPLLLNPTLHLHPHTREGKRRQGRDQTQTTHLCLTPGY